MNLRKRMPTNCSAKRMETKVLQFDNSTDRYRMLAERCAEKEDFLGALGFLFSALKKEKSPAVLMDIADIYADMSLYELSNQYWFYYLDRVPEDKASVAYEELAINYFYLGNILASGYYFHLKIQADGYIQQETLDKEIVEFFSEQENKRKLYRVAYPPERADFSFEMDRAKRALAFGDYELASKLYSVVPEGAPQYYSATEELSVAKFLTDDIDEAIKLSQKVIKEKGESISVCCNLSSMYGYKGNSDKREYYYKKALTLPVNGLEDAYKIATCSLENGKHQMGIDYLSKVFKERPYDLTMRLFSAIAKINVGDYSGAEEELSYVLKINPTDYNAKYYYGLVIKLKNGGNPGRLLPLKYLALLPSSVENARIKKIDALYGEGFEKIRSEIKKASVLEIIKWGLSETDTPIAKKCTVILAKADCALADKIMKKALMNAKIEADVKRMMIQILILRGCKERLGITAKGFYFRFKPKKLPCEKQSDGELYFTAYSMAMSRMIFVDPECLDKIAFATDRVYKKLGSTFDFDNAKKEEIAALIVSDTKMDRPLSDKDLCAIFDVTEEKFVSLKRAYKGDNYDKDN